MHFLHTGGSVGVHDGGDVRRALRADPHGQRHMPQVRATGQLEVPRPALRLDGGGERPEVLAELDRRVDPVAHLAGARIGEDAPVAERARAELEPSLRPADHETAGQQSRGQDFGVTHLGAEMRLVRGHAVVVDVRAEKGQRWIAPGRCREIRAQQGRTDSRALVPRGRLHVDAVDQT